MKSKHILPLFAMASLSAATLPICDNIGLKPDESIREFPFKPVSTSSSMGGKRIENPTALLDFKSALPAILVPSGVKRGGNIGVLFDDRFYYAGDVIRVEILKDPQLYSFASEEVTIKEISESDLFLTLPSDKEIVRVPLPAPDKLHTAKFSSSNAYGSITYVRHQTPVQTPKVSAGAKTPNTKEVKSKSKPKEPKNAKPISTKKPGV